MRRHRVRTAAVLTGVALTTSLLSFTAAPAPGSTTTPVSARWVIEPSRFPGVAAVARIFPAYRGGGREFLGGRQASTTTDDCLGYELSGVQPRAGRTAHYYARGGQSPFFSGGTSVVVSVSDYRRPKRAQAALDEQRAAVEACYGRHLDPDGYGVTYTALDVPDLAQDQFAFRYITHDVGVGRDWFISTYAREGRFLLQARVQRDRDAPAVRPAFRLARAGVRAVS